MEVVVIIALIVFFLIARSYLVTNLTEMKQIMQFMHRDIAQIQDKLNAFEKKEQSAQKSSRYNEPYVRETETTPQLGETPIQFQPGPVSKDTDEVKRVIESTPHRASESSKIVISEPIRPVIPTPPTSEKPKDTASQLQPTTNSNQTPPRIVKPPKPTFRELHPDFEKFIGENIINKIGIAILVLGIGFFVKYAIDQDWINEIGRLFIGILCGGILIGIAHHLRKSFSAFSSVLIGGGLSVLYFSIGIGFQQYHLLSQEAAFGIMVIITAFAVVLSLLYNRIELAVVALFGGFGTPFFVSTGEGNYLVLFTYLIILNVGMLVLASIKKWNLINLLSYIFTIIIYGGWLISETGKENAHYTGALVFGTIFYIIFFLMNISYNLRTKQHFQAIEFSLLLSNTFLYYAAGMVILHNINDGIYQGLFTAAVGVFNFVFALILHHRNSFDKNLFYLLIGLVLTFISLAAPIQLKGNHITMFWSAEMVLLLWLSQKSGLQIIKAASVTVGALMIISLLMDWSQIYTDAQGSLTIIVNKGFITSMISIIGLSLYALLLKKENETSFFDGNLPLDSFKTCIQIGAVIVTYFACYFELSFQLNQRWNFDAAETVIIQGYNFFFAACLSIYYWKKDAPIHQLVITLLIGLLSVVYAGLYNPSVVDVRDGYLSAANLFKGVFQLHFIATAIFIFLLVPATSFIKKMLKKGDEFQSKVFWIIIPVLVYVLSAEMDHIIVWILAKPQVNYDAILIQNHKFGYPILWGLISFILVIIGMRKKDKTLRIIGLSLFSLILLKLFAWDIWGMSQGGKILAFVLLGVLLLVISFMYQKLKKIITDDEEATQHSQNSLQ